MPVPRFERRLWLWALVVSLPGLVAAGALLWAGGYPPATAWLVLISAPAVSGLLAWGLVRRVRFPLRTLSNQLASLREGDYTVRVRGGRTGDALGELTLELNALGDHLRERRLEGLETAALLRTVTDEINVAVFAFDPQEQLRLVNRAGEQLLGRSAASLVGRSATEMGLAECLAGEPVRILDLAFGGRLGRWALRRSPFRDEGRPHQLIVLTDVSRALREEERQAWRRLLRVLGHELNNSLAPIRSLAASLAKLLDAEPRPPDCETDLRNGLGILQSRAEALSRFMEAYARLARLPEPVKRTFQLRDWIERATALETRIPILTRDGPAITLHADPDQLDQVLINLLRNAVDAALASHPPDCARVELDWRTDASSVVLLIRDNGPGPPESANLFVPFFTTKPGGSGVGLVLSRQILDLHDGSLSLRPRADGPGAEAVVRLPL